MYSYLALNHLSLNICISSLCLSVKNKWAPPSSSAPLTLISRAQLTSTSRAYFSRPLCIVKTLAHIHRQPPSPSLPPRTPPSSPKAGSTPGRPPFNSRGLIYARAASLQLPRPDPRSGGCPSLSPTGSVVYPSLSPSMLTLAAAQLGDQRDDGPSKRW